MIDDVMHKIVASIAVCMASLQVSKTPLFVGTRTLALLPFVRVSDIPGLQIYSLAGLSSPCWSMFVRHVVAFLH